MAALAGRRRRLSWTAPLVTLALGLTAGACSPVSPAKPKASASTVKLPDGGTLYLGAGPSGFAQNLYRIRGDGRSRPEQLTSMPPGRNLSVLTAGSGQVIVSEGSEGTDKIARLVGDRLERLIDDRVFSPSLSDDGRLAYVRLHEEVGRPNEFFVVIRELATGLERIAYKQSPSALGSPAWGPAGLLAVVETDAPAYRQTRIVLIAADGTVRTVELGDRASTGLVASQHAGKLLVVGNGPPPGGFLLDPTSGQREGSLAPGWVALTWAPDGTTLLVADGRRLGLIRPPNLAQVEQIGTFPAAVWQADWVAAQAKFDSAGMDDESTKTSTKTKEK